MPKFDETLLTNVLIEIRSKAMMLQPDMDESNWKSFMNEYNMLFVGPKGNQFYSSELLRHLQNRFHLEGTTNENLNQLIPTVCQKLNMPYFPMILVRQSDSKVIDHFKIDLF